MLDEHFLQTTIFFSSYFLQFAVDEELTFLFLVLKEITVPRDILLSITFRRWKISSATCEKHGKAKWSIMQMTD